MPATAMTAARMPAEKLSTSISKPGLILSAPERVEPLHHEAVSGPMIIAPRNIGAAPSVPMKIGSLVAMMTPITENPPTTPPRTS